MKLASSMLLDKKFIWWNIETNARAGASATLKKPNCALCSLRGEVAKMRLRWSTVLPDG